jgi:glycosyltransferase involved in cell wall biosynthesis
MKVSVVATVLNEEENISSLLDSLLNQTQKPDEIVIVDGGSTDKTQEIIKDYSHKHSLIHLFVEPGSISHGRNSAVNHAKNQIIAQIDAGCIAHETWLEKIIKPFENPDVGLVAGFYHMKGEGPFAEAIAPFHGVPPHRYDPRSFMPSGRSMAFKKEVWQKVGGYSENLERAGEDTLFNYKILKENIKIVRVKDAIVDWELPKDFRESLDKLYHYAQGDAQGGIWWHPAQRLHTHNIRILTIFARYLAGLFLLSLSMFIPFVFSLAIFAVAGYIIWSINKTKDVVFSPKAKLWVPVIQISSDLTIMAGFLKGLSKK